MYTEKNEKRLREPYLCPFSPPIIKVSILQSAEVALPAAAPIFKVIALLMP